MRLETLPTQQLSTILMQIADGLEEWLVLTDTNGQIRYMNTYVEKLSGYGVTEAFGKRQSELWLDRENKEFYEARQRLHEITDHIEVITKNRKKDGEVFYLNMIVKKLMDDNGNIISYLYIGKDLSNAKYLQEKIYFLNHYDALTHLPNQHSFCEFIYRQITENAKKPFGVILIDVQKMNYINTTYGVKTGDNIIHEVGRRLQSVLRKQHMLAKLGGDVFGIVEIELESPKSLVGILDSIVKAMREPVLLEEEEVYIEISAGIVTYPMDATTAEEIINKAKVVLEKAKKKRKNSDSYMFYTSDLQEEIQSQMRLESDLYKAYDNDEFIVYYQPFVQLNSEKLIGLEALLRRAKRNGEIVLPGKFISLLEQMKLIDKVGIRVVEKVCKQLREWMNQDLEVVPVAINLSMEQFKNRELARNLMSVLEHYDIPPHYISFEITETVMMEDMDSVKEIIEELRRYGFCIAIDDFGTGYSSLSYLKKFSCDHLKIDISFIKEIENSPEDRVIVAAIISIAKCLRLKTIAEGIETKEQFALIHGMGCEIGQGYLWDAPMTAKKIEEKYLNSGAYLSPIDIL